MFFFFYHQDYAVTLAKQLGVKQLTKGTPELGRALSLDELNLFRDEQVSQLYELMLEAKKPKVASEESDT